MVAGLGPSLGSGADMGSAADTGSPHILAEFDEQEFEQEFVRPEVCISS